jgi:membrane-bound lytic murein transglycosylase B
MVDLSGAVDGDGDGLIEIGPNDTDGNQALANLIANSIEDSCDLDD